MKKSDFDFSIPNRQSYVAILLILFKTINLLFRQLLPVIAVVLLGGSKNKSSYLLYVVITIALLSMLYSLVNFFKTYFIVQKGELVLYTGVFSKKKMSIPFGKIQTINFEQNIVHQFFSVLRIKVDTAGSEKNEFEFHALESSKAYALRDLVMAQKTLDVDSISADTKVFEEHSPMYKTIIRLSNFDLFKVGLTENHIKSGSLVLVFFFWIYQNLQDVGVDVDDFADEMPDISYNLGILLFVGFMMIVVSIMISLVRTIIRYYDFHFLRTERGFKIVSGLFTRMEISAWDHKIQYIAWSDNILKRLIGYKDLSLNQASSKEITSKQNIHIPGCKDTHISDVIGTLFGDVNLSEFEMSGIDRRYFVRFAIIVSVLTGILLCTIYILGAIKNIPLALLFAIYLIVNRYIGYRKKTFGYNAQLIYIKGGIYADKAEVLPIYKIQAIQLHQSPYQTKHGLCDITLYTASGRITIPYIDKSRATSILDTFIHKVESDTRKWM